MGRTIGDVRRAIVNGLVLTVFAAGTLPLRAIEPADPEMTAEAREVLNYLLTFRTPLRELILASWRGYGIIGGSRRIGGLAWRSKDG